MWIYVFASTRLKTQLNISSISFSVGHQVTISHKKHSPLDLEGQAHMYLYGNGLFSSASHPQQQGGKWQKTILVCPCMFQLSSWFQFIFVLHIQFSFLSANPTDL